MLRAIKYPVLIVGLILFLTGPALAQKKKKIREQKASKVISVAKGYIGTPYKYGGTTGKGIDCSGLMLKCFEKIDYQLPRTAKAQSKVGKKVGRNNVKPGDIVFFKFKKKGKSWFHSGVITVSKNGKTNFIHASSSRGVIESDLDAEYYSKRIKGIRRVIK